MKLVIIGAGSSYTPELIQGIIEHHETLPFTEVCLMDVDERRLEILAGLTRRMLDKARLPLAVTATTDRRRALEGATFVNCLLRVGGMDARINDERIPLKYGIIGQETVPEECADSLYMGTFSLKRNKGGPTVKEITDVFVVESVCLDADDNGTCDSGETVVQDVWIFNLPFLTEYFWDYDANGLKLMQVRFYRDDMYSTIGPQP